MRRTLDQHRDDLHIAALQAHFDFDSDKIVGVIEPPLIFLIGNAQPLFANNDQHHIAFGNGFFEHAAEVRTGWNVVYVFEYIASTEFLPEPIIHASGDGFAVGASVGDKKRGIADAPAC
jgi:hypothetical protein